VLSILYILPILPLSLSTRAYRLSLILCLASHLLQFAKQSGSFPLNLQGLQQFAARALPSQHFTYAITALMFISNPPVTVLLLPYVVLAAYGVSAYCAAHFATHPLWQQKGARVHDYLIANRVKALSLNAQFEVSLGFNMLVLLFTQNRNFILTFFVVSLWVGWGVGGSRWVSRQQ